MIYIEVESLECGMLLGKEIWGDSSFLPLICVGHSLTEQNIEYLKDKKIPGVYILSDGMGGIDMPKEIFSVETKVKLTAEIKKISQQLRNEKGNIMSSVKAFDKVAEFISGVIIENTECMLNVVEIKSYNEIEFIRSMQVGIISTIIGKKLKFNEQRLKQLAMAAVLSDIGKMNIPAEILNKVEPLTKDEEKKIKKHTEYSFQKLSQCKTLSGTILDAVACHHEKYDGTGYPYGLQGTNIPVFARIIAIADVYEALTSPRPYRQAWEARATIDYMTSCAGTHFDTEILSLFLASVAAYPVGVIIELDTGEIGVVTKVYEGFPLNPVVKILSPWAEYGKIIDLANNREALSIKVVGTVKDTAKIKEVLENSTKKIGR